MPNTVLIIDSLKFHLAKEVVHIDNSLLQRMVRAGIMCPAFTEQQKAILLQAADIKCPIDIKSFMSNSRQQETTTQLDNSYIHITQTDNTSLLNILNATQTVDKGESDEESYFFCEKEDDEESFYKLQLI